MKLIYEDKNFKVVNNGVTTLIDKFEAKKLYSFADPTALRILDRLFVKKYLAAYTLPDFLDAHQRIGIDWILTRARSYLAHAPGAGKTAQAIIASFLTRGQGQTIFIVPPSLTLNWKSEIEKFAGKMGDAGLWPIITTVAVTSKKYMVDWTADFIICPDSMITKPWVLEKLSTIKKKFIAVDEASRFKEAGSSRTVALFGGAVRGFKSPGLIYNSKHVVLLDGSPMPNRPIELWAPTFAMAPETIDFREHDDFGFRYCGATRNKYGWEFRHSSREAELKEKLQKDFMHVVTEEKLSHPERLRSMLFMNKDVRSVKQKKWEQEFLTKTKLSDIDENISRGEIAKYRQQLGVRKVPWASEYISERLENKNESILVFAWHREVCELLLENLKQFKPGLVMGGTKSNAREKYFEQFLKGARKLLILNIAAAARGYNLQRADRCIFPEFSWSDELNKQCEKRASRRGRLQSSFVRSDYIVCPSSMDEPVLNAVFNGAKRVKGIIG